MYFNNSAHVLILSFQMRFYFKYHHQKDIWAASHIREWVKYFFFFFCSTWSLYKPTTISEEKFPTVGLRETISLIYDTPHGPKPSSPYLRVGLGELQNSCSTLTAGASSLLVVCFMLTMAWAASYITISLLCLRQPSIRSNMGLSDPKSSSSISLAAILICHLLYFMINTSNWWLLTCSKDHQDHIRKILFINPITCHTSYEIVFGAKPVFPCIYKFRNFWKRNYPRF